MADLRLSHGAAILRVAAPRGWSGPAAGTPGHRPAPAKAGRPKPGGARIRTRRLNRGLTLKQLAKAAGLSKACVAHIETGRNIGRPETLAAIEKAPGAEPGAAE